MIFATSLRLSIESLLLATEKGRPSMGAAILVLRGEQHPSARTTNG